MYSKRIKKNSSNTTKVSQILSSILPKNNLEEKSKAASFFSEWESIVGDALAKQAKPLSLNKGTLIIETTDSVYAQEISFLQETIKYKLSELGYGGSVSKIKCITTNPKSVNKR